MSDLLSIGQVAATTGIAISAVRYYDKIGLIETETRVGGKRRFSPETVGRVSFIRRMQDAGFSLEEAAKILDDGVGGWRELVDAKLVELHERRDQLDATIATLEEISMCGCSVVADCEAAPRRPNIDEPSLR